MRSIKTVLAIIGIATFLMHPGAWAQDEDWFDKGLKLLNQKRYDDAIKAFSIAIEIIPRDYQSYNYRGVSRALKGNFETAIADYNKAIEIRPRYAGAYNNRGFAHTRNGNLRAALNDYTRSLEINPFFVDAYNNKAWVLATCTDQQIRDGGQALRLALKAVELKSDINSLDTLAAAYAAVGNFDSAIDTQKKAIQELMRADNRSEVPKYIAHLKSYKSRQSLLIDYTARPKPADTQSAEVLPKTRNTEISLPPADSPKTAAAAKTPKPNAAPTANKPIPAPVKPLPPAKKQKSKTAAKTAQPATAPAAPKTKSAAINPLPYTIQVSAFRDPQRSIQVARKLNSGGDPAYTNEVDISGKGKWYRVYIGNYKTLVEAKAAAADLKNRKFRYVNVTKKPYTIQVGAAVSRSEIQKLESRLQAKGYFSYHLPSANEPKRIRILIGAFESKQAATSMVQRLTTDGFSPTIALK